MNSYRVWLEVGLEVQAESSRDVMSQTLKNVDNELKAKFPDCDVTVTLTDWENSEDA